MYIDFGFFCPKINKKPAFFVSVFAFYEMKVKIYSISSPWRVAELEPVILTLTKSPI